MNLQNMFGTLSRTVEQLESQGRSVRELEVTTVPENPGVVDVSVTVSVPLCAMSDETGDPLITPETASIRDNDDLVISCSVSDLLSVTAECESVAVGERAVRVEDGEVVMTVDFALEPSDSGDARGEVTEDATSRSGSASVAAVDLDEDPLDARLAAVRSDDVPAYDDVEYLRELYESCETFTEMSTYIEMDIAAETVRRYMIEADIHEPATYDTDTHEVDNDGREQEGPTAGSEPAPTGADRPASPPESGTVSEEQLLADGIGLPDDITVDDVVDAVADATSVYEVQRSLGLDQGETRELLKQLNLIDLVLHRIDDPRRDASRDDIVRRMRQHSGAEA